MKSFVFLATVSTLSTRGDPSAVEAMVSREPLLTLPSSAPSAPSTWRSDSYHNAAMLLQRGFVNASVIQQSLSPSSTWWLR